MKCVLKWFNLWKTWATTSFANAICQRKSVTVANEVSMFRWHFRRIRNELRSCMIRRQGQESTKFDIPNHMMSSCKWWWFDCLRRRPTEIAVEEGISPPQVGLHWLLESESQESTLFPYFKRVTWSDSFLKKSQLPNFTQPITYLNCLMICFL